MIPYSERRIQGRRALGCHGRGSGMNRVPQQCVPQGRIEADGVSPHPALPRKYSSVNTKVTESANNSSYGSRALLGQKQDFLFLLYKGLSLINKPIPSAVLGLTGHCSTPRDSSIHPEVPALPPSSNQCLWLSKGGHWEKNHIIYPLPKKKFSTNHCSAFSAVSIVTLQPAKDLAKQMKRRERSVVATRSPVHLSSARLSWLDLSKGSFYLGVVT